MPNMSAFWEMDDEDKALIIAVYETEKMMEALELQEAQPAKGQAAIDFGEVRKEA